MIKVKKKEEEEEERYSFIEKRKVEGVARDRWIDEPS